jgi:myo-inositol-1(or 4)-monophosphatase
MHRELTVALEAAQKGGEILRKYWGQEITISHKDNPWNLVTNADKESEQTIVAYIKDRYPHDPILAEESGLLEAKESHRLWCIDPLDGTTNYTHGFPMVAISIALVIDGEPRLGVVYNPILNEVYSAVTGCGAFLNDKPLRVSAIPTIGKSLLVTGFAYNRSPGAATNYQEFCHLTSLSHGVRRVGSAALDLAFVAAGRFDGYWEQGLGPWDMAAGTVLVREAGGRVTSFNNEPLDIYDGKIIATNGHIHDELIDEIKASQVT